MNPASSNVAATTSRSEMDTATTRERSLPSGRSVVVKVNETGEELQVRSPDGEVEVRITFGESGPIVHLSGARLQLEAVDTIALDCQRLEINAEKSANVHSDGSLQLTGQEMRLRTTGDIHLNGEVIHLN